VSGVRLPGEVSALLALVLAEPDIFLCKMHQHNRCEGAITVVIQRAYKLFHIQTRPFLPPAYIRYQGKRTIAHIHDRHARPRRPSRLRKICVDALAGRRGEERYAIFAENA
jgi:hypothetical protein